MYIALLCMLMGVIAGRIFRNFIAPGLISRIIFAAILALLFLLGAQIGCNDRLFAALPVLGCQAFLLMLGCTLGSICAAALLQRFLKRLRREPDA